MRDAGHYDRSLHGSRCIENQLDGFVIPIRSVEAIKERLEWLYHHRNEAREMGLRARKKVADRFTWHHYEERLINAYNRILLPWADLTCLPLPESGR